MQDASRTGGAAHKPQHQLGAGLMWHAERSSSADEGRNSGKSGMSMFRLCRRECLEMLPPRTGLSQRQDTLPPSGQQRMLQGIPGHALAREPMQIMHELPMCRPAIFSLECIPADTQSRKKRCLADARHACKRPRLGSACGLVAWRPRHAVGKSDPTPHRAQ